MVLRYAYAAAAGLVLGVLAYHFISGTDLGRTVIEPTEAAGSMTSLPAEMEAAHSREVHLNLPDGSGAILLERLEDGASLLVDLDSPSELRLELVWETERAGFRGMTQELGRIASMELAGNAVSWTQQGHNRVAVKLDLPGRTPATIDFHLFMGGELIQSRLLAVPGSGSIAPDTEETASDVGT